MIALKVGLYLKYNEALNNLFSGFKSDFIYFDSPESVMNVLIEDSFDLIVLDGKLFDENTLNTIRTLIESSSANMVLIDNPYNFGTDETIHSIKSVHFSKESDLIRELQKYYLKVAGEKVKTKIIRLGDPIFAELSQCLLQINAENQSRSLDRYLKELDHLYLKIKPIFEGFHVMELIEDSDYNHPFPLLDKIRFFISRYQQMGNNKVLFKLHSDLSYTSLVIGNYFALSSLIELGFSYCLWHTEYGLIDINIDVYSDNMLKISFSDTGSFSVALDNYQDNLATSFELLLWIITLKLGGEIFFEKDEDTGFEVQLIIPALLFDKKTKNATNIITETDNKLFKSVDFEQELINEFINLKTELRLELQKEYTNELTMEWRKAIHKIWPSVKQMGDATLASKLELLQQLLKNSADLESIKEAKNNILKELKPTKTLY
ncbi:hypothetical protein EP331_15260 [bacterium]|nr:MAG: hypothetical protein EP331_15260 [bacterium]